jgi:hypothetical protein
MFIYLFSVGRDSSVGIATNYGLDGPGSNLGGARYSALVLEAHPASYTMDIMSFPGPKRPGRGVDHPPHLAPRYIYSSTSPLGLRGPLQGEL